MYILIEEYQYDYEDVYAILKSLIDIQDVNKKVSLSYVGYFFNPDPDIRDCIFILPKIILEGEQGYELAFGHISPKDLINFDKCKDIKEEERKFIYNLSVWIYRSIKVFKNHEYDSRRGKKKSEPSIVYSCQTPIMGHNKKRKSNTFLDVLLALQQWNKTNENFVTFILKNIHSGFNKINWVRTIAKTNAIINSFSNTQEILYTNPINKKKKINFDEELIIIYYSILNHMKDAFGFPIKLNVNFNLIQGKEFSNYLKGYGKRRLKQIKYKYFSDKALEVWELCYAFFEHPYQIQLHIQQKEYLLVKNFYIVFEAIIDELIAGDQKLPTELLDQEDGKRVDHLYHYKELTNNDSADKTYYIGDSKYYKRYSQLDSTSVYKQFTYARNVIQWNMDLFNDGSEEERKGHILLRDKNTEGYNIIPNFFISAHQEKLTPENDIQLSKDKKPYHLSRHFENRLFDRDTLLIAHYDVNFLFIISLYGRNKQTTKLQWREKVRAKFRKEIQEMLERHFIFYAITPHEEVNAESYIHENFHKLNGKIFQPFKDVNGQQYFSLALRNPKSVNNPKLRESLESENEGILQVIDLYFYRANCPLGKNPSTLEKLPKVKPIIHQEIPEEFRTQYHFEAYPNATFLVGTYKNSDHLNWILDRKNKKEMMYNVRIDTQRKGAVSINRAIKAPNFLFLYNYRNPTKDKLRIFRIHNAIDTPKEFMEQTKYPNPRGNYVSYVLESESITFGQIDIPKLLEDFKLIDPDVAKGKPIYITGKDILKYRIKT